MKHLSLTHFITRPLVLCLLSSPLIASAQMGDRNGPPKVLVIYREFLKPGKSGMQHEKTESEFVRALTAAKSQSYYFGMDSLSGPSRSLFFFGFPSFEAWEKDTLTTRKNTTLSAALDHASSVDGELLSNFEQSAFIFRDDLSLNTGPLLGKRYMEITQVIVKPGHTPEIEELAALYRDGMKRSMPTTNSAAFQLMYGYNTGDVFLFISTLKSLSETDREVGDMKKFMDDLGDKGRKHLTELSTSAIQSIQTNLFELNPKISYPPEEWIKADPGFWKPRPSTVAKKPDTTPAK
jgi:hypothetical protein